jgi:hypothetical protein
MKKLVKAFGNGAHIVLPVSMLGKEVIIMKKDYVKDVLDGKFDGPEDKEKMDAELKKLGYL